MIDVCMGNENGFFYRIEIRNYLFENFNHFISVASISAIDEKIFSVAFYNYGITAARWLYKSYLRTVGNLMRAYTRNERPAL